MSEFETNFWADFLSNLALIILVALTGYLAKTRIIRKFKDFIHQQVVESLEIAEEHEKKQDEQATDQTNKT
jgi:hypothetical protein